MSKKENFVTHITPVEQYADHTESYFTHLKNCKYFMIKEITYKHGYGTMKGTLWAKKNLKN